MADYRGQWHTSEYRFHLDNQGGMPKFPGTKKLPRGTYESHFICRKRQSGIR